MRNPVICLLALGGLLQYSVSLPQTPAPAGSLDFEENARQENMRNAPTLSQISAPAAPAPQASTPAASAPETLPSVSASIPNVAEDDIQKNMMRCTVFDPPDHDTSVNQCQNVCGDAVAKQVAAGNTSSISCIAFGIPIQWEKFDSKTKVAGANCSCNNAFIDELATDFLDALPIIAEIGCTILMGAFSLVVEVGALAIPGVGEAIDGGMIAGIEAAKLAAYSYNAGEAGLGAFSNWANPCGNTSDVPKNLTTVFNILNAANPAVLPKGGLNIPKGLTKGGGKPGDKGAPNPSNPNPPNRNPPKDDPPKEKEPKKTDRAPPKKTDPPRTNDRSRTTDMPQASSNQACSLQKRAPGGNNNNQGCNDQPITSIYTSRSTIKTITETCTGSKYAQACYHYYSAIKNYGAASTFTCSDSIDRAPGIATGDWTKQHKDKTWQSYTQANYNFGGTMKPPRCQADEYPPAYFMPQDTKQQGLGQIVRWLPGSVNGGAANTQWAGFCGDNDGGKGNGQLYRNDHKSGKEGEVNKDLVSLVRPGTTVSNKVGDKFTTTVSFEAVYQRAVFEMHFDGTWDDTPSEKNDWGLSENPCWPQDIVTDDPGYALLTDDKWYTTRKSQPQVDLRASYSMSPPADLKAKADKLRWQKRPASPNDNGPSKQKPKTNPPSKRALEIMEDGFAIRDANTTRRLTDEEVKRDVEVIQCADRTCFNERRALGDEDEAIIIPGGGPSMTPPTNIDSVPTIAPRGATTLEIRANKRRAASPELPVATGAAPQHVFCNPSDQGIRRRSEESGAMGLA